MRNLGDQLVTLAVYGAGVLIASSIYGVITDARDRRLRRRNAERAVRAHQDGIRRQVEADIRAMERQKHWA